MERTGKTVETGGEGEHGRAQSRANQVGSVSADVATLVVRVDGEVEAHQLNEVAVAAIAELIGQVKAVILVLLDRSDLAVLENVAVDLGGNGRQLGNEVHRVLEGVLPVILLVDTLGVGLREGRLLLKGGHSEGELRHWVEIRRTAIEKLNNELGDIGAGGPFGG